MRIWIIWSWAQNGSAIKIYANESQGDGLAVTKVLTSHFQMRFQRNHSIRALYRVEILAMFGIFKVDQGHIRAKTAVRLIKM